MHVFQECAGRIRPPGREAILDNINEFTNGIIDYIIMARSGTLDQLQPHIEAGNDNKENHEKLYNNHFSSSNGSHYATYRKLRSLKTTFRCPYCGFGRIKVVDHFLPKSVFFRYSVFLDNLVPCCRDCNTEKDDHFARPGEGIIFHPYFDQTPSFKWLATSFCAQPFSVSFSVMDAVAPHTAERLRSQMEVFDLGENYAELATNYYTNIRDDLTSVSNATDPIGKHLATHLTELRVQALSDCGGDINYWKVAFLDQLVFTAASPDLGPAFFASLQN